MPNNNNLATGTYIGTGATINVEVGFSPSRVELVGNQTADSYVLWFDSIPDAYGVQIVAATSIVTSANITPWAGEAAYSTKTGTISSTAGSSSVTGSSTTFLTQARVGDEILIDGVEYTVVAIASDTALTLDRLCGSTVSGAAFVRVTGRGPGFTVGTDAVANNSGDTYYWCAQR